MNERIAVPVDEEIRSAFVGVQRQQNALRFGRESWFGDGWYSRWEGHIEGAGFECAVSLWSGEEWVDAKKWDPPFHGPDVGEDIETRRTRGNARRVEKVRIGEKDFENAIGRRFVFGCGCLPEFELLGWLTLPRTPDAFDRRNWRVEHKERTTWEIPVAFLQPMSSFARRVAG